MYPKVERSGSMGFCSVLTLIFITLKLVGTITWSWWWVLSPMWVPLAIVAVIFMIAACFAIIK